MEGHSLDDLARRNGAPSAELAVCTATTRLKFRVSLDTFPSLGTGASQTSASVTWAKLSSLSLLLHAELVPDRSLDPDTLTSGLNAGVGIGSVRVTGSSTSRAENDVVAESGGTRVTLTVKEIAVGSV